MIQPVIRDFGQRSRINNWGYPLQGLYHEFYMFFEWFAKLLRTQYYILAVDIASEGFVLHLFEHGTGIHLAQALAGLDESRSHYEAAQLVAREQGVVLRLDARHAGIGGV